MSYDVVIVGGGIVGFSAAFQLLQRDPSLKVAVLEKESAPAQHQTGHNSGVIHAGVYYQPGSLKAKFCVDGCRATKTFCSEHGISFKTPGKLIVAVSENERERLHALSERCQENGLTVEPLSAEQVIKKQPGIRAAEAFVVKETGIVDWKQVCAKYVELFECLGGKVFCQQEVVSIDELDKKICLKTQSGHTYEAKFLVTCAGLYADRMVRLSGLNLDFRIIPFRGEYYQLAAKYNDYFRYLIYPVPDSKLPFLGVHFTPQMAGFSTVGPNAVLALAREGYAWSDINLKESLGALTYWPFWKFVFKHFSATCSELRGSFSKKHYLKSINAYFPDIRADELSRYPAGVRAQAVSKDGKLIQDFLFVESDRILHTCNAPSPAATSSLPIGRHIVEKIISKINRAVS